MCIMVHYIVTLYNLLPQMEVRGDRACNAALYLAGAWPNFVSDARCPSHHAKEAESPPSMASSIVPVVEDLIRATPSKST
jgi:hypothetical protein